MTINLDSNTPNYLASLFILLLKDGIEPNQIMVGVVRLATDTQDLEGMITSVDCLRSLLGVIPIENNAEGITDFVSSLALEGVTTLMLLDALSFACDEYFLLDSASTIRLAYQRLHEDIMRSKVLED